MAIGKEKYFSAKVVMRGWAIHQEVHQFLYIGKLCTNLNAKNQFYLFLDTNLLVYKEEVMEFYTNQFFLEGNVATSKVHWAKLVFNKVHL